MIEIEQKMEDSGTEPLDEGTYHDETKLINISTWSKILSWIVLGYYVIAFVMRVILELQNPTEADFSSLLQIYTLYGFFSPLIFGSIYFLTLQAISEGINMLWDLEENSLRIIKDRNP
jgi:amino acid permease